MIPYHGLPITDETVAVAAIGGGHAFVSFRANWQLPIAIEVCQSFAVDNGAFSAWQSGHPILDWSEFYAWVAELIHLPMFDFAVIPDVIDGDEAANDALLVQWPHGKFYGAPVWHLHESLNRLVRLSYEWPRVCIGSSGEFSKIGTPEWETRMRYAMAMVCDDGLPRCKLHGLRMLNPDVFTRFPFASADSTNIGRNVGIDSRWKTGSYRPASKRVRAIVMREKIEINQSAPRWRSQK